MVPPGGWLAYVKEPEGEIRLSEFFTGDEGWIVVGARIHPSGYFRDEYAGGSVTRIHAERRRQSPYRRMLSSFAAITLIFLSSGPLIPKKVAIWTSCFGFAKSLGSAQNFSRVGPNSRQVIDFGIGSPSRQVLSGSKFKQNSQIFNAHFFQARIKS